MIQRAAARPGIPDVVAAAAGRCAANWRVLAMTTLAGAILVGVINFSLLQVLPPLDQAQDSPEQTREFLTRGGPFLFAQLVVQVVTETAVVAASLHLLRGKVPTAGASLATGIRRAPATMAATLIFAMVVIACAATIILIPLGIYFAVSWAFLVQVIADERAGPLRALAQSRRLVRGNWWRTLSISVSLLLLAFLINLVIAQIGGNDVLASFGAALGSMLTTPFLAMGLSIVYEELRAMQPPVHRPEPPPWERTDV